MDRKKNLHILIQQLIDVAYPELDMSKIVSRWRRMSCFASVSWNPDRERITVTCNHKTKRWHEAALLGLLSHELSHPVKDANNRIEKSTDLDVIRRGLGPYLAVERAMTGKYEDYVISHGKDMYLGYRSIRSHLNEEELVQLDALLAEMRLVPKMKKDHLLPLHDLSILKTNGKSEIFIDGHLFSVEGNIDDSQVEIVIRNGISHVYHNGQEIGKY
ncbi:MAG: hypothetical protein BV458_11700 [Thermoplasmata archaeon M9B2D]|nr:MAG: hypothetical protein BV458_11700 [Thermoplasmata archaeon M9B2D]